MKNITAGCTLVHRNGWTAEVISVDTSRMEYLARTAGVRVIISAFDAAWTLED